jgi:type I restriction enzyme S subunit
MVKLKKVIIEDEIELIYGKSLTKTTREDGPFNVYGSNGVIGKHSSAIFKGPGIIIGRKGTVGSVVLSKKDFHAIDTTYVVKLIDSNDDLLFWYYFLKTLGLENMNSHSAVPGLSRGAVYKKEVQILENFEDRVEVAKVLSCLDEKIELNNSINKNLEEIAQAIFKSWFIDFEPFQEGEFEDSEFGRIPKGWRVTRIDDVTRESNTGGDAIQKTPMVDYDTGIKCVRVGDLSNQRSIVGWGYSNVNEENFKKFQLKKNDIVVTRTASLGLNQIIDEDLMAVYNNGLIRIKLNEKVIPLFFYQSINTDNYKEYIGRIESESSTRPNMKMNYLLSYKFICPPIEIQEKFVNLIEKLRQQRLNLYKQIDILAMIRDSILPKLMNGEIRIPIEEVQ